MRRSVRFLVAWLAIATAPISVQAKDAPPAAATPSAAACVEPAADATASPVPADSAALEAISQIPLDRLPAIVGREEGAERGDLSLSLPGPLSAIAITAVVTSNSAGPIGSVDRVDDYLVFRFEEVTYDVNAIELPAGGLIAAQSIKLDPAQPSTLCVNLTTGKISRDFHWLMTGTNVEYDGSPTIALGDHGRATVASVTAVDADHYAIHLQTHWQSELELTTWSLDGSTLPSGKIQASAEFEGTYVLDFSQ